MSDFQHAMNHAVQGFVMQITELARRTALDTLESAFGGRTGRNSDNGTGNGHTRTSSASGALSVGGGGGATARRPRGAKRTAADLEELATRFVSFVKANPGLRIEQINKELGTTTKDLALPIRKLISDGVISAKGQKRSTAYFSGSSGSSVPGSGRRARA
jgi:hypothetical protein